MKDTRIILHNIRSAYNVGSIFRTADAAGVSEIFLTGYTPVPKDKFGRWRKDIGKVALGAEKSVSWEYYKSIEDLIIVFKNKKIQIVAVEQDKSSKNYKKVELNKKHVFIFGNEVEGLPKKILSESDLILEIPMKGKKESLNVSVVAGIILFNK